MKTETGVVRCTDRYCPCQGETEPSLLNTHAPDGDPDPVRAKPAPKPKRQRTGG